MASAFLPTVRAPVLLKPEEICTDAGRVAQGPSRIAESRSMEQIKAALAEQSGLVPEDPPLGANGLGSLLRRAVAPGSDPCHQSLGAEKR